MKKHAVFDESGRVKYTYKGNSDGGIQIPDDLEAEDIENLFFDGESIVISPPVKSLSQKRDAAKQGVIDIQSNKLAGGCLFEGNRFAFYGRARQELIGVIAIASFINKLPDSFSWETVDNAKVPLTMQNLKNLVEAMVAYEDAVRTNAEKLCSAIDTSQDPDSVDITTGWPG